MRDLENPYIKELVELIEMFDEFDEVQVTEYGLIDFRLYVYLDYDLNSWSSNKEAKELLEEILDDAGAYVRTLRVDDYGDAISADIELA